MGNRSSWQTVSQNSTGNDDPCCLRVLKSESSALQITLECERDDLARVYVSLLTAVELRGPLRS